VQQREGPIGGVLYWREGEGLCSTGTFGADMLLGYDPMAPLLLTTTRKRFDALVALVEAGDLAGLELVEMPPPRSTSPMAPHRDRRDFSSSVGSSERGRALSVRLHEGESGSRPPKEEQEGPSPRIVILEPRGELPMTFDKADAR
jgi:hypothetical protein